jgi:tetratricopeptide (TPR) repeat protein
VEAFSAPLRKLADEAQRFVRRKPMRLFHVVTDGHLRDGVIDVLLGLEYHADNFAPFVRFDAPHAIADGGWRARQDALREAHEARRKAMEKGRQLLKPLRDRVAHADPAVAFGLELGAVLGSEIAPLDGVMVLLAPGAVERPKDFDRELLTFVKTPALAMVRWIVVDLEKPSIGGTLSELGEAAASTTARVDEKLARLELEAQLRASTRAGPNAPGLAQTGAAWPREAEPPRRNAPPPLDPAQQAAIAKKLGIPQAVFEAPIRKIRPAVIEAALAMRDGKANVAVEKQREAVEHARAAGLDREAMVMELVMATYAAHAGAPERAEEHYVSCADRSVEKKWPDLAAQALFGAGALAIVAKDRPRAVKYYGRAGTIAEDGDEHRFAIEAWRTTGHLLAELGDEMGAVKSYGQAMAAAKKLPDKKAAATSAPQAGRELARLCKKLGLSQQAIDFEAQAIRLEAAR